ncbi:hypothetical protein ACFY2R_04335 [Micromonospora olivasterospora]|uniref:Uncharacterized protein n=1 Tax=Micromonospora olivasterospora TaxID=1880 RepID=A0A562IEQ2_MICOL|nr:hypothetical protein [Micromonospora olivasterospora]TWH69213.1 hypothetical protein JD77_04221 [Micromonospora olivasterospora]
MSRVEDRLNPNDVLFGASLVAGDHEAGWFCRQCTPHGCDLFVWARSLVDLAAADMAQFRALVQTW